MDPEEHMSAEFVEKRKKILCYLGSRMRKMEVSFPCTKTYPDYRLSDPSLYIKVYDQKILEEILS